MSQANEFTQDCNIQVRLFGAFRDLSPNGHCTLRIPAEPSVAAIKIALARVLSTESNAKFDVAALMAKSVLATESRVLGDSEIFSGSSIAILPPVCGG